MPPQKIPNIKFTALLLKWNKQKNRRQMPWKGEKDVYKIWLSEIILQQTRVDQGLVYYKRFVENFPTIHDLAACADTKIYKHWEGLGYYNRCKNLIETARFISKNLKGKFPDTFEGILALKGVGPYTAAAIASFAFNLPHAVLDGNVFRVLARIFGIKTPVDTSEGKKLFQHLSLELLNKKEPGKYNQAIMDFGAVICKPVNPLCDGCTFKKNCQAYKKRLVEKLPVKSKKNQVKKRNFFYLILEYRNRVFIRQRMDKDIWKNLYEFELIETKEQTSETELLKIAENNGIIERGNYSIKSISGIQSQLLSHQKISGQFIVLNLKRKMKKPGFILVSKSQLQLYPFPGFINSFLTGSIFNKKKLSNTDKKI